MGLGAAEETKRAVKSIIEDEAVKKEDVAAAACRSVAEQVYETQIQEMEMRPPVIFVGGVSLVEGVQKEFERLLGTEVIVPENSQYAGAVGIATLVSGI